MCVRRCIIHYFYLVQLCGTEGPVILPKYPQQCQMVDTLLLPWKQALTLFYTELQCWANAGMTHVMSQMDKQICSTLTHLDSFASAWLALVIQTVNIYICL